MEEELFFYITIKVWSDTYYENELDHDVFEDFKDLCKKFNFSTNRETWERIQQEEPAINPDHRMTVLVSYSCQYSEIRRFVDLIHNYCYFNKWTFSAPDVTLLSSS